MASKRIAFPWYGGKNSQLVWLLPLLPKTHSYVEPFGGSAAVLLNREPSPIETYNDLDGDVVNFFRVLRNHRDELLELLRLTPYAREEFRQAVLERDGLTDVERARRFYVRARMAFSATGQITSAGSWSVGSNESRCGMSMVVSRWRNGIENLDAIVDRILRVQIENRPAVEVIRIYDTPNTLIYCDPPYMLGTRTEKRGYAHEMDDAAHEELASALNSVQGKVALSGYRCDAMDTWYKGWRRFDAGLRFSPAANAMRHECVWMNYDPPQEDMFVGV